MNKIQIIENASEIGAGTRGASLGIDALKIASINQKSNYFRKYNSIKIDDWNHLLFEENKTPSAIRIEGIVNVFNAISTTVKSTINESNFPLVLAADHASAGGTIAGLKSQFPDKRIGVIWIDAHGDLHSPYTSPTGNVHGMPLATALNEDNLECKVKEVDADSKRYWDKLKNLNGIAPKINSEDLIFFGVRDTEYPEDKLIERYAIKNFKVEDCREKGMKESAKEALSLLNSCDIIYISFDVDSMDCDEVSLGTGTPVSNGFIPQEAEDIMLTLLESKKVVCFEMVEINPTLDNKQNLMAETAFKILENVTNHIEKFSL